MAYADIDTALRATRASGDLTGRIGASFLRKAVTRAPAAGDDQRELRVIAQVMAGTAPAAWTGLAMERLDSSSVLANPTDAQIDTAVTTVWNRLVVVA